MGKISYELCSCLSFNNGSGGIRKLGESRRERNSSMAMAPEVESLVVKGRL